MVVITTVTTRWGLLLKCNRSFLGTLTYFFSFHWGNKLSKHQWVKYKMDEKYRQVVLSSLMSPYMISCYLRFKFSSSYLSLPCVAANAYNAALIKGRGTLWYCLWGTSTSDSGRYVYISKQRRKLKLSVFRYIPPRIRNFI